MKVLLFICAAMLFVALADLPIGFYTILRIIITIGAGAVVLHEIENGSMIWVVVFVCIGVVFNPLWPVYLKNKEAWIPLDIIAAICFSARAALSDKKKEP